MMHNNDNMLKLASYTNKKPYEITHNRTPYYTNQA